ncbi:MAG TPA: hypothetical protein DEP72_00955 [Clostridiales bacterium]|nr:MAG: hypothetical protein A2Y18_05050 [Clostridiales bacterium GWD2_32_19]HCC06722.1 hypothetical protein [Clostridiales bacterium]
MIKIIGMLIVIATSAGIGFYIPKLHKNKIEFLIDMRQSFYLLKNEINYSINTIVVSFFNIYEKASNQCVKQFFYDMYEKLQEKSGISLKSTWETGVNELLCKEKINENEAKHITSFGNSLGYLDREQQLKNIDFLVEGLDEIILMHKEKYEKHSKLYSRMGILVGLMATVVLL